MMLVRQPILMVSPEASMWLNYSPRGPRSGVNLAKFWISALLSLDVKAKKVLLTNNFDLFYQFWNFFMKILQYSAGLLDRSLSQRYCRLSDE